MMARRIRALVLAIVAAAIALTLARKSIAASLVGRGDTLLYRAQTARALLYYRRALAFDSHSNVATDRFAFAALIERKPADMQIALRLCSELLRERPREQSLRLDRALLLRAAGQAVRAEADFESVGLATRDARLLAFAGFEARSAGRHANARRLFRESLQLSRNFGPVRRALDRELGVR